MHNSKWTERELTLLSDTSIPNSELAGCTGRTEKAVAAARARLKSGYQFPLDGWTDEEDGFLLENMHIGLDACAEFLSRPIDKVRNRRKYLKRKSGHDDLYVRFRNPSHVGTRALLAKTCPLCGILLDAKFYKRKTGWATYCTRCHHERYGKNQRRKRDERGLAMTRAAAQRLQDATKPAPNSGKEWTSAEEEVIMDETKSNLTKAIKLGRTYAAVLHRCHLLGATSVSDWHLGSVADGEWRIEFPETA